MRRIERASNLPGDLADACRWHRSFGFDHLFQASALKILHYHERTPILGFIDILYPNRVGVLNSAGEDRLLHEPFDKGMVAGQLRIHNLERAQFFKTHVLGLVNDPHAAFA
jgi:hypothetical protein